MASTSVKTMLESAAYARMRAENPSEFVPRSVFFAHEKGSEIDRRNSLWVKAALVYDSITGRHVNDKDKPVATSLLLRLADACCPRIHGHGDPAAQTTKKSMTDARKEEIETPQLPSPAPLSSRVELDVATQLSAGKLGAPPAASAAQTTKKSVTDALIKNPVPAASQNVSTGEDGGKQNRRESTDKVEKTTELPPDEGSDENKRAIDGIFLVVGFLPRLLGPGEERKGVVVSRDAIDEGFKSTHMQDIVTDVIKLENQLPLTHLLHVVDHVEKAIQDAAVEFVGLEECLRGYKLGFNRGTFHKVVVTSFCSYYSPFFNKQVAAPPQDGRLIKDVVDDPKMAARTLLDLLHDSLVPRATEEGKAGAGGGKTSRMPTARELSRSGVRVAAGEDGRAVVVFEEQSSRLRLPALVYDFKLATVARNLRAREYVYEEQSKPVTRYFQMMNELVEETADARILRRAGVVRAGGSGSSRAAQEVHDLIKRIDGCATYPSVFMAMDVQIEKVRRFHDKRMQKFLVRYRPGVIWVSSVATVSAVAIVAARRNRA